MTGDELLADVLANPDDDGPRLVYADWLASRSDPRGELITVQCAIAAIAAGEDVPPRLTKRESQLLSKHGKKWRALAAAVGDRIVFRRGFVTSIRATPTAFANHGAALLAREPLDALETAETLRFDLLASSAHLARLRRIKFELEFYAGHADWLRTLLGSPNLAAPELDFKLQCNPQYAANMPFDRIFIGLVMPSVTHLRFVAPIYAYPAFAKTKLPALQRLELSGTSVDAATLDLLTRSFPHAKVRAPR